MRSELLVGDDLFGVWLCDDGKVLDLICAGSFEHELPPSPLLRTVR
jgi:hypothetical protein